MINHGTGTNAGRRLAVVTGASTGVGLELARLCARDHYDLIIAAEAVAILNAAEHLASLGVAVSPVQCDLSRPEGVQVLLNAITDSERTVDVLIANAGRGLGRGFLDQDLDEALKLAHTNINGTIQLIYQVGRAMRDRGHGRILITGSIAGLMPGRFQAIYNGTMAFLDSFSVTLSNELKDSGVTVTSLMPGATDTDMFQRADAMDARLGADDRKADAEDVARAGYQAMMNGRISVIYGFRNRMRAAVAAVAPDGTTVEHLRASATLGR